MLKIKLPISCSYKKTAGWNQQEMIDLEKKNRASSAYISVLRHPSLRRSLTLSWVDEGDLWLGNLSRYPDVNLSEWGWDLMDRRPDAAGVWEGRPRPTDSRPFVMEKSCLSWPSHPSPLLDPYYQHNHPAPPPPTPALPSYPPLIPSHSALPTSTPLSFVPVSSCSWSDYRADCTTAALQFCASSRKGASLFVKLVFNCFILLKACVFWTFLLFF